MEKLKKEFNLDQFKKIIGIGVILVSLALIGIFIYLRVSGSRNSNDYALISIGLCLLTIVMPILTTKSHKKNLTGIAIGLALAGLFIGSVMLGLAIGCRIWG